MSLKERTKEQYGAEMASGFLCESPPLPKNMMVELSNACNHACTFCPNPHMSRDKGRIDKNLMFRIMEDAHDGGVSEIGFYTTGEPFIDKRLPDFVAYAKKIGFEYTYISTNGALATAERAKAVIDAGWDSIKFSINAGSRETYKFIHGKDDWDKVLENLDFISEYRKSTAPHLKIYLTCVVTRQIEHELDDMKARFEPIFDEMDFDFCAPLAFPLRDTEKNEICPMPFNRLHVTREGYLTLCCVDFQNYVAVADLNKMSVSDAWNSPDFVEIRRRHLEKDLAGTFCGRCWWNDPAAVEPLNAALAEKLDFDEYDKVQTDWIEGRLQRENT